MRLLVCLANGAVVASYAAFGFSFLTCAVWVFAAIVGSAYLWRKWHPDE